jgi:hypothetical protein
MEEDWDSDSGKYWATEGKFSSSKKLEEIFWFPHSLHPIFILQSLTLGISCTCFVEPKDQVVHWHANTNDFFLVLISLSFVSFFRADALTRNETKAK